MKFSNQIEYYADMVKDDAKDIADSIVRHLDAESPHYFACLERQMAFIFGYNHKSEGFLVVQPPKDSGQYRFKYRAVIAKWLIDMMNDAIAADADPTDKVYSGRYVVEITDDNRIYIEYYEYLDSENCETLHIVSQADTDDDSSETIKQEEAK